MSWDARRAYDKMIKIYASRSHYKHAVMVVIALRLHVVKQTYKKQQEGEGSHKKTDNENGDKRSLDFHLLWVLFQLEHTATNTAVHNYTNQK